MLLKNSLIELKFIQYFDINLYNAVLKTRIVELTSVTVTILQSINILYCSYHRRTAVVFSKGGGGG